MKSLSATDIAIAIAVRENDLRYVERPSRFGDTYVSLEDSAGVIETHANQQEAKERVSEIVKHVLGDA